jgi:hypothetical protein
MENKEAQKKLLVEIMEADAKDGLYKQQTAVEWLYKELYGTPRTLWEDQLIKIFDQARQMEVEKTIKDYNAGYDDAKCNHINDADNYANESEYINSKL